MDVAAHCSEKRRLSPNCISVFWPHIGWKKARGVFSPGNPASFLIRRRRQSRSTPRPPIAVRSSRALSYDSADWLEDSTSAHGIQFVDEHRLDRFSTDVSRISIQITPKAKAIVAEMTPAK